MLRDGGHESCCGGPGKPGMAILPTSPKDYQTPTGGTAKRHTHSFPPRAARGRVAMSTGCPGTLAQDHR
jgi:hypothetical protein